LSKGIFLQSIKTSNEELKQFEDDYQLTSAQFLKKFNQGELGDDEVWFDWLFAIKAHEHISEKLNLINESGF